MVCVRPCRYRGNFDGSMEWTAQLSSQMVALLVLQASSWNHHWRRGPGTCGAGAIPPPPPCAADPAFTLLTPPSTMGSAPSHLDLPAKFGIPLNTRVPCSRAEVKVSWLPWVGCVLTRCLRTWWDDLQRNMVALAAEAKQKRGQYWNDVAFISADSTTYTSQHMIVWHDGSPPQGTAARPIDIVHFDGVARVIDSPPMQGSAARPIDMAHIDAWGNATGRLTHQRMHRKMHELRNQFQTWLNANPGAEVVDLVRFLEPNQSRHCPFFFFFFFAPGTPSPKVRGISVALFTAPPSLALSVNSRHPSWPLWSLSSMSGPQVAVHGKLHVQIVAFTRLRVVPGPPIQVALRASTFHGTRRISAESARDNVANAVSQLANSDPSLQLGPYNATPQWMRCGVCAGWPTGKLNGFAVCCHMGMIKEPAATDPGGSGCCCC